MAATRYFNRDEAAAEQKEQEARLEEEMERAFSVDKSAVERTQEMFDVVFSLMEIRI